MLAPSTRHRLLRRLGLRRRAHEPAIVAAPNPAAPERLPAFRLFAIVGTWLEGDVIGATVRNAFAQGCERVYLIDNDSPDDTGAAARAAGAVLGRSFASASYDEGQRIKLVNEVIEDVSWREACPHVWWLCCDADEFHHGPGGRTVREYLATLDRRFRIVGARTFNHFPDRKPEYLPGFHPLDFQPLCQEFRAPRCPDEHWKHPLLRVDRRGPRIVAGIGFHKPMVRCRLLGRHTPRCAHPTLVEPAQPVFMHHFQYRDEALTRRRLERLCVKSGDAAEARIELFDTQWNGSGISKRFRTLSAVYRREWDRVENLRRTGDPIGVSPQPWAAAVPAEHTPYRVWYAPEDVERARAAWAPLERDAGATG
jgi:hypothetical protein